MTSLTVVTPTYNRKDSLRRTLDGLARQTYPRDAFEVVVVSDGSTDGTPELLAEYAENASFALRWFQQENGGPSRARNKGIAEAKNDVVVLLDDDVEPIPEFLARHAAHHERDEKVVVLGLMSPDPSNAINEPAWIAWEHAKLQDIYDLFRPGGEYCGRLARTDALLQRQRLCAADVAGRGEWVRPIVHAPGRCGIGRPNGARLRREVPVRFHGGRSASADADSGSVASHSLRLRASGCRTGAGRDACLGRRPFRLPSAAPRDSRAGQALPQRWPVGGLDARFVSKTGPRRRCRPSPRCGSGRAERRL